MYGHPDRAVLKAWRQRQLARARDKLAVRVAYWTVAAVAVLVVWGYVAAAAAGAAG